LPINRSAIKRARTSKVRQIQNASVKSLVRTALKKYEVSLREGDLDHASELLKEAASTLDRAAQKGVIHKNEANRRKSRLARKLFVITEKAGSEEKGLA
jgi:small subunit ribosomal protein S20